MFVTKRMASSVAFQVNGTWYDCTAIDAFIAAQEAVGHYNDDILAALTGRPDIEVIPLPPPAVNCKLIRYRRGA